MRRTVSVLVACGVAVAGCVIGAPTAYADSPGWIVVCPWSHSLSDDPIVFPGNNGASHRHDFFGNMSVDADSTEEEMLSAETTCQQPQDTSGYWVPTVFMNGKPINPNAAPPNGTRSKTTQQFYYRIGAGQNAPQTIQPFPAGLQMVAGNGHARSAAENPKLGSAIYWGCSDNSTGKQKTPPNCKTGIVSLHVGFPSCWNGTDLDSADHQSHMAYPSSGKCPTSHPVAVPRLIMRFEYPVGTSSAGLMLSSGPPYTIHGDFWNTWDQATLAQLVQDCLNAEVNCGKFD
jgi:hypothetical protein